MLPRSASMGKQSADAQKQTVWSCPRHSVACECAPPDAMEGSALESLVHSQWKSAEDREAVLTKLKDCGIRSTTVLRKCVQTPVWHSRIPQNCFYRGAPPLINHLINERCDDAKLLRSRTLEAIVKRCRSNEEYSSLQNAIREWSRLKSAVGEREQREVGALLMDNGIYSASELRCAVLFAPHAPHVFEFPSDLRERLGLRLCKIPGCKHHAPVGDATRRDKKGTGAPRCKVDGLCLEGLEGDGRVEVMVGLAADSEAEAKNLWDRLRSVGIGSVPDLQQCVYIVVGGGGEGGGGGEALVNKMLREKHGEGAVLSELLLRRLADATRLEMEDGTSGVLFTAPHGIWLRRNRQRDHKPEVYTSNLATALAQSIGSSYAAWAVDERIKSQYLGGPDSLNTDPNHSPLDSSLSELPWNRVLQRHARRFPPGAARPGVLHVDIHGRRDVIGGGADGRETNQSDVDVGVGAMLHSGLGDEALIAAEQLRSDVASALRSVVEAGGFVVSVRPHFEGYIAQPDPAVHPSATGFGTMTMQAVRVGLRAVQLELSLRLRKALYADAVLRDRFARALLDAAAGPGSADGEPAESSSALAAL